MLKNILPRNYLRDLVVRFVFVQSDWFSTSPVTLYERKFRTKS